MGKELDLLSLFQTVTGALEDNKKSLNDADSYNGDHGDNMVQIFNLISNAIDKKPSASPSTQLKNAGKALQNQTSGSAKVYAEGLFEAAETFKGKSITTEDAMTLVQTLLGGGKSAQVEQSSPLGGMLSGLLGSSEDADSKFDAGDLLNAGMAFLSAKNEGQSTSEALIEAVTSASPLGEVPHRAQSSQVVVSTILDNLGKFVRK